MAFGAASGPPASPKQIAYLKSLVEKAGFGTFREARRTLGLSQRQAAGRFTMQEASDLIDRLLNGEPPLPHSPPPDDDKVSHAQATLLRGIPAQLLADELIRRGWTVDEPT